MTCADASDTRRALLIPFQWMEVCELEITAALCVGHLIQNATAVVVDKTSLDTGKPGPPHVAVPP